MYRPDTEDGKSCIFLEEYFVKKNKVVSPTIRLIFGIIFIVMSVIALFQSMAVSAAYSLASDSDGTSSGAAGLVVAILMMVVGIIFIAARKNNARGIKTSTYIMCAISLFLAVSAIDSFSDMGIYAVLMLVGVIWGNMATKIQPENNTSEQALNKQTLESTAKSSTTDEIMKFKKLLDDGAITQEEFDAKKKELLNI
jgi:hypothetical protein